MAILETLALQGFRSCPPGEMSAKGRFVPFTRGPAGLSSYWSPARVVRKILIQHGGGADGYAAQIDLKIRPQ